MGYVHFVPGIVPVTNVFRDRPQFRFDECYFCQVSTASLPLPLTLFALAGNNSNPVCIYLVSVEIDGDVPWLPGFWIVVDRHD
ncbi:MAG: hypothetical protein AMXMBFR84_36850 [Candidatus Hydrogenedentota bacterium]